MSGNGANGAQSEPTLMLCHRCSEFSNPIKESTVTQCVRCSSDLWLSPESKKIVDVKNVPTMCGQCAKESILFEGGEFKLKNPSAEQAQELRDHEESLE
jgi:DNA-directed RNA polymerase subunit RPC12/RpoP